jgi:hypothetical protein
MSGPTKLNFFWKFFAEFFAGLRTGDSISSHRFPYEHSGGSLPMPLNSFLDQVRNYLQRGRSPQRINGRKPARPVRLGLEVLEKRIVPTGTWNPVTAPLGSTPGGTAIDSSGTMLMLSDGTAMVQGGGSQTSNAWYRLTPDKFGSYINGSWSTLTPMNVGRAFYGSAVLPNGNVYVLGGELATDRPAAGETNTAEIFNPVANNGLGSWTPVAPYPENQFGDGPIAVLSDGRILAASQFSTSTYIYNPATNLWTNNIATSLNGDNFGEEGWVKLPDNSILDYQIGGNAPRSGERFVLGATDAQDAWVATSNRSPVSLASNGGDASIGAELGPSVLLPNGSVFWIGATNQTAFYTPATGNTGSWTKGPNIPQDSLGNTVGAIDAPAAVESNGKVLFAASTATITGGRAAVFGTPTTIFEYDPSKGNTATNLPVAVPNTNGPNLGGPAWPDRMLDLPDGNVLFSNATGQLYVYTPDSSPSNAWRPTITSISGNGNGSATLTGTQLNGLSEGSAYGDDAQMASNYPIVRLYGSDGITRYARTFNWSSTGVATGSALENVQFTVPSGTPDVNQLSVIANGIASAPVVYVTGDPNASSNTITLDTTTVLGSPWVTVNVNGTTTAWSQFNIPAFQILGNADVFVAAGVWSSFGNSITVRSTLTGLPTFIDGGALGTVTLGHDSTVQDINGNVTVESSFFSSINVDDSADGSPHTVTLKTVTIADDLDGDSDLFGQIAGLTPATALINYEYQDTFAITISTGGGAAINVQATGTTTNLIDTLNQATGGLTSVNVGFAGSLQGILGTLNVDNPSGGNALTVDDSADKAGSVGTLATFTASDGSPWGSITGLSTGAINYAYIDTSSLTLDSGSGASINVLATGTTTNLVGAASKPGKKPGTTTGTNTTVNVGDTGLVGSPGSVLNVLGTLNVSAPGGSVVLTVDDSQIGASSATLNSFTDSSGAKWGTITGLSFGVINYEYAQTKSLTLATGPAATIQVSATGTTTNLIGTGETGADQTTVNVGAAGSVQNILGTLNIDNPLDSTIITVDDSADSKPRTAVTLGTMPPLGDTAWGYISGLAPAAGNINYAYADTASLTVKVGGGKNTYNVQATGVTTTLDTGSGNDVVNLGKANLLLSIQASLTVVGQGGNDTLNVNDLASTDLQTYGVKASVLYVRPLSLGVTYSGINSLVLNGSQGGSTYNIESIAALTAVMVNAGQGDDTFNISPLLKNLDAIAWGLTLNGGGGANTSNVDDQLNTAATTYSVNAGVLYARPSSQGITYTGMMTLVLNGSQGGSIYNIQSLANGAEYPIFAGHGDDTFKICPLSQNWSLLSNGHIDLFGGGGTDAMNFYDQASPVGHLYTVANDFMTVSGDRGISFTGLSTLNINCSNGVGGNTIGFFGIASSLPALNINAGTNVGRNTLEASDPNNSWDITNPNTGTLNQRIRFSNVGNLSGSFGVDTFKFEPLGTVLGLDGVGGSDWLDYSALTTAVTVNLATGSATNVNGGAAGSATRVQNVHAGNGGSTLTGNAKGNILVGGAGVDTIIGGTGRSLLIGDGGADHITGGSTSGGDILIGGTTSYDSATSANFTALMAIFAEWQSAASYNTRFAAINNGTIPGGYELNYGTTVHDDGAANVLTGAASTLALDWFFAGSQDLLFDRVSGEHVNNV